MKVLFIFNHRAGMGISTDVFSETVDFLIAKGISVRYVPSYELRIEGAITREEFLGADRIICSGGDGTLSQLTGRLYELGILHNCAIGYIPAGSTNDYAAGLSIPPVHPYALHAAVGDALSTVDLGLFNGRTFTYVAAFGLFTEVAYSTDQNLKNALGHNAYIISGAKSLLSVKPYRVRISVDEAVIEDDIILCMISNARQVGGFKGFFDEGVSLNDGLFEVTIIRNIINLPSLTDLAGLVDAEAGVLGEKSGTEVVDAVGTDKDAVSGVSGGQGLVMRLRGSHIRVESEAAIDWTLDGEYGGSHETAEISVIKEGVRIFTAG